MACCNLKIISLYLSVLKVDFTTLAQILENEKIQNNNTTVRFINAKKSVS